MRDLAQTDFPAFFEAVQGTRPFAWQQRLLERVLDARRWPDVIDLPTGVGKTAAIDIACFALACAPESFPRRIVFVIDRRLIVDQVLVRGRRLAQALANPQSRAVAAVASRLQALGGGREPLHLSGLRGGVVVDDAWARWPDQPCLLVSTVDQFGSRLLFRGYGVSNGMRPIHAGLAGADCLVLLDEVHLSHPLAETLRSIATRYRPSPVLPDRWQIARMSATPGEVQPESEMFQLADQDFEPEISRRVRVRKSATLLSAGKGKHEAWEVLPGAAAAAIAGLPDEATTIGVIVNRVRTARAVREHLAESGYEVTMLTGRMRPFDREEALAAIGSRVDPDRPANADEHRGIVVATQCIEVGADFSFDALVTECAPIDALRQRFGRLDRRGRVSERLGRPAQALIVGVHKDVSTDDDPVYGSALASTWRALRDRHGDNAFDVGPLSDFLPTESVDLLAPTPHAPLLLPSHLDAFIQTSPRLRVGPEPGPFLHGIDVDRDTDVRVVWRADIALEGLEPGAAPPQNIATRLTYVPPRSEEAMPVPIRALRAWLAENDEVAVADTDSSSDTASNDDGRLALRWRGADDVSVVRGSDLRPGDLVVVPAAYGGIRNGNWDPTSSSEVADYGDRAQLSHRRQVTLRLDPRVLPEGLPKPPAPAIDEEQIVSDEQVVTDWLAAAVAWCQSAAPVAPKWLPSVVTRLSDATRRVARAEDPPAFIVTCRYADTSPGVDVDLLDGSDAVNSITETGVTLREHLQGVGSAARSFAESLGLSDAVVEDMELAGRLHDLGKADPRFQLFLHHGDEVAAICAAEPLAKSRSSARAAGRVRARAYRGPVPHPLLSVALAESCSSMLDEAHDRDLVLHLVASHHGYCRPLPEAARDTAPVRVDIDVFGQHLSATTDLRPDAVGVVSAERFWSVVERYGWYGTAWLEAIFRLADHRRSETEESTVARFDTAGSTA